MGQNLGQYTSVMDPAYPGMDVTPSHSPHAFITLLNSASQAKQTIANQTVGGTIATETFTVTITGVSPVYGAFTRAIAYTATSGQTAAQVAAALAPLINADEYVNDILTVAASSANLVYTVRRFGVNPVTSVAGAATGAATLTAAPTVTSFAAAGAINLGYAVGQVTGDADNTCRAITTASGLTVRGIAYTQNLAEQSYPVNNTSVSQYPANFPVPILTRGLIWVPVAAAVTTNTQPFFLNATGQLTTNGAGSATALPGALYRTTQATAGGLALVEINLPA